MNKLKIPSSFKLMTKTIDVNLVETLNPSRETINEEVWGITHFNEHFIAISKGLCDREAELQTFYHELIHIMLHYADPTGELTYNEDLVDRLGHLLYQFLSTQKGDVGTGVDTRPKQKLLKAYNNKKNKQKQL